MRIERIYQICEKLRAQGLILEPQRVFSLSGQGKGTVGRLHVARAMVEEGLVSSNHEAFNRFIGDHAPSYVANFRVSPKEAIESIRNAGGIAVLAHPYSLGRDELIPFFVSCGLGGLEVYYPEHTQSMVDSYLHLVKKFGLLATGGSDYHGRAKPEVFLGSRSVPYDLVAKLKFKLC